LPLPYTGGVAVTTAAVGVTTMDACRAPLVVSRRSTSATAPANACAGVAGACGLPFAPPATRTVVTTCRLATAVAVGAGDDEDQAVAARRNEFEAAPAEADRA
jgi:hypothetical protein